MSLCCKAVERPGGCSRTKREDCDGRGAREGRVGRQRSSHGALDSASQELHDHQPAGSVSQLVWAVGDREGAQGRISLHEHQGNPRHCAHTQPLLRREDSARTPLAMSPEEMDDRIKRALDPRTGKFRVGAISTLPLPFFPDDNPEVLAHLQLGRCSTHDGMERALQLPLMLICVVFPPCLLRDGRRTTPTQAFSLARM